MNKNLLRISVIGAGVMGITSAYTLQRYFPGASVTLHDSNGFPADNASYAAGGMLAPLSELDHMPQTYLKAGYASINIWKNIAEQTNNPFEFSNKGSLFITHPEDRHMMERFKSLLPAPSNDWSPGNENTIKELEPSLNTQKFNHGLYMKNEAHLNPRKAMAALLSQIKNKKTKKTTPKAQSQNTDWVIDCRGINAKSDSKNLRGVKGEIVIVQNKEFSLTRPLRLMHPRYPLYIVPREDNIFMIGATIIESNEGNYVTIRSGMELMSALYSIDKSFGDARILEMKSGIRPSYPDNLPRINIDGNIITANGLYRHGFLFAPVIAETIAHHIADKSYEHKHLFS